MFPYRSAFLVFALISASAAWGAETAVLETDAILAPGAHGGGGGGGYHGGGGGGGYHGGGGGGGGYHGGGGGGGGYHGGGNPGGGYHGGGNPGGGYHGGGDHNGGNHGGGGIPGGDHGGYHGGGDHNGGGYHGGGDHNGGGYHGGGDHNGGGYHGGGDHNGGGYHGGGDHNGGGYHGGGDHHGWGGNHGGGEYHGGYDHDGHGNVVTHDHQHYVDRSNHEVDHRMRNNGRVREVVTRNVNVYNTRYREFTHERYEYYNHCTVDRHLRYDGWRYYGFYGGYWWTWGSYYDVSDYYWNPMVFWFYTDDWDYYYYHRWYRHHFRHYPELQERFLYAGDYFPTEAFRDLLLDMSGRSIDQQIGFRRAMNIVTEQLETQLDPAGPVAFERNEIVVTHFELLGYDGVELEGFASHGQVQAPFKMVLDLNNPGMSLVFVPHSESVAAGDPQLESLSALNARIVELGGTVSVETPAPAPAPVPAPVQ